MATEVSRDHEYLRQQIEVCLGIDCEQPKSISDHCAHTTIDVPRWSEVCVRVAHSYELARNRCYSRFELLSPGLPPVLRSVNVPLVAQLSHVPAEVAYSALRDLASIGLLTKEA